MSPAGTSESVDRRVLGGFVMVDAITNASVTSALSVTSTQLKLRANRSGIYAIFDAPGFSALNTQFIPVTAQWPASAAAAPSFEVSVQDPTLRYLPRRAQVGAPQPLASLGTPQRVALYPSASAGVALNWAVIRAAVTGSKGQGLPWAVVRALKSDNSVAATGVTDARGEALLAVPGLGAQISDSGSGPVTVGTTAVTVQAWFDPSVLKQPAGWIPNPDDILNIPGGLAASALPTGKTTGSISATQVFFAGITISV